MRINITGFNGAQFGKSTANRKGVLNFSELIREILTECGHEAGFQLENADLNMVFVIDPSSINAGYVNEVLPILREKPCIVVFDDWNIKGFYKTIDKIIETQKFSKTHHTVDWKVVLEYMDVWKKLSDGDYLTLYPAHKVGDHSLLEIRGESYYLDPSIYMADKRVFNTEHEKHREYTDLIPVHASLANKWQELSKKNYSFLNLKGVKEDLVFEYYSKYRMVMSPVHYHDGSGWFRGRYIMAATANAIIVDDQGSIFGKPFEVLPKQITKKNIEGVLELQKRNLYEGIMTKEEVREAMNAVLEVFKSEYK